MRTVTLYATGRCNLRCKHCAVGNDQDIPRPDLTSEQIDLIFSRLQEAGTETVTILGGEASIYRFDLPKIFQSAVDHGLKVSLNTNLILISSLLNLLSSPCLYSIVVSLDGAESDTHDLIRGPGTFNQTKLNLEILRNLKHEKGYQWDLDITFVINKVNLKNVSKMLYLVNQLGIDKLNIQIMSEAGRSLEYLPMLHVSDEELLTVMEEILLEWEKWNSPKLEIHLPPAFVDYYNQKYDKHIPINYSGACSGVIDFAYVDLTGNLLPCPNYSYENKNLFKDEQKSSELSLLTRSVNEILTTPLFAKFEQFRSSGLHQTHFLPCKFCKYNNICLPCTSEFQEGNDSPEMQPCKAMFEKGDKNIVNSIFTQGSQKN